MRTTPSTPNETSIAQALAFPLVLFDDACPFCNRWVQWVIGQDTGAKLRFAPSQSPVAQAVLDHLQPGGERAASVVFVKNATIHTHSEAVLHILSELGGPWQWTGLLRLIPRPLRDAVYGWIAANRHRFPVRSPQACALATPALRARFLSGSDV